MGMSVVASFLDPVEAEIAAGALRSAGFEAVAMDQYFASVDSLARQSLGGMRVGVPDAQLEEATAYLRQLAGDRPEPSAAAERGDAGRYVMAFVIGTLLLLSWMVIRPETLTQRLLVVAGASALPLGWIVAAAIKSRGRSSQLPAMMLVFAGFLALAAVMLGLGWLVAHLPHWLYPNGRS